MVQHILKNIVEVGFTRSAVISVYDDFYVRKNTLK